MQRAEGSGRGRGDSEAEEEGPGSDIESSSLPIVLSALKEVVQSQVPSTGPGGCIGTTENHNSLSHEPTPTEFFAAIIHSFKYLGVNKVNNGNRNHILSPCYINDLLQILAAVTAQCHPQIVKSQFFTGCEIVLLILSDKSLNNSPFSSRITIHCLAVLESLIKRQDVSHQVWSAILPLKAINIFLRLLTNESQRLRELSSVKLASILQYHRQLGGCTLSSYIFEFCMGILKSCSRSNYKSSLYIIQFLSQSLVYFSDNCILEIVATLLKLQECQQVQLTVAIYRLMDSIFQNYNLSLDSSHIVACFNLLLINTPQTVDMEARTFFCTAVTSLVIALQKKDWSQCKIVLLPTFTYLISNCQAEFTQIHCAVGASLKRIINACFENLFREYNETDNALVVILIQQLEEILNFHCSDSWIFTLDSLRTLFEHFHGYNSQELLGVLTEKIGNKYVSILSGLLSVQPSVEVSFAETLISALKSLGIRSFLTIFPLYSSSESSPNFDWVLRILQSGLKSMPCHLEHFEKSILSVASLCNRRFTELNNHQGNHQSEISLCRLKVIQLWSLLPLFCLNVPLDFSTYFARISTILTGALNDPNYPEFVEIIALSLHNLVIALKRKYCSSVADDLPRTQLNKYSEFVLLQSQANIFLGPLLSIVETMEVHDARFKNLLQYMSTWVSICPQVLISTVSKKLIHLLLSNSSDENDESVTNWLFVILVFVPFQSEQMCEMILKTIKPFLSINESLAKQKRAYSILEQMLVTRVDWVLKFEGAQSLVALIADSLLSCHVSSRYGRLKCLNLVLHFLGVSVELNSVCEILLPEILVCLKDPNKKTRDESMNILKLFSANIEPQHLLVVLCSGFVAETPTMRSAAINALTVLLFERRNDSYFTAAAHSMLSAILPLVREESAEETKSVLTFIRVFCVVSQTDVLRDALSSLFHAIFNETGNCKSRFASRLRAILRKCIRRLGSDVVGPEIPESDIALFDYILKQQRRSDRRRKGKEKVIDFDHIMGSDSDNSDDEDISDRSKEPVHKGMTYHRKIKATRIGDMKDNLPTSVDELISYEEIKKGQIQTDHSEEPYQVKVTDDGKVIVTERETVVVEPLVHRIEPERTTDHNKRPRIKTPGDEYKSAKSGGDVWRSGMLQPHAYIPLDAKLLARRNEKNVHQQIGSLIETRKVSAEAMRKKGMKLNRNQRAAVRKHH